MSRYVAIALAAGDLYSANQLTPEIMRLHNDGVRRGQGAEGAELEAIHGRAELIGKAVVPLGILLIGLHVFTLRGGQRDEDEDEDDAVAPLPPGAR